MEIQKPTISIIGLLSGENATLTGSFSGALDTPAGALSIDGTAVTSTAAELNYLDGADTNITTLSLPASTTISAFGKTLVDDADASTARGTLGLTTTSDVQFDSFGVGTAASGVTGEIRATGDITAFYSSDERLKENIKPIENATDKVKAIGGYTFVWREGIDEVTSKSGKDVGIIAQELEKVLPELVNTRSNGYKGVDYPKLVALLIQSNKELAERVEKLESKFN